MKIDFMVGGEPAIIETVVLPIENYLISNRFSVNLGKEIAILTTGYVQPLQISERKIPNSF